MNQFDQTTEKRPQHKLIIQSEPRGLNKYFLIKYFYFLFYYVFLLNFWIKKSLTLTLCPFTTISFETPSQYCTSAHSQSDIKMDE